MNDTPAPPDPTVVATADANAKKDISAYDLASNRINTQTPYYTDRYNQYGTDPKTGAPLYDRFIELAPNAQATIDQNINNQLQLSQAQNEFLNNARGQIVNPLTQNDLPDYAKQDYGQEVDKYGQLLNKQTDVEYDQLASKYANKLANQGINLGSTAYDRAMAKFGNERSGAYSKNALNAYGLQNQMFNQDMSRNGALSSQKFALANLPLNQYNAMIAGTQVAQPNFSANPVANTATTDVAGIYNNNYAQQVQAANASNSGFNSILGAAANAGLAYATGGASTTGSLFSKAGSGRGFGEGLFN
jgi:hypothetical protein